MQILITAGGTREYIDPVRFISNASSGRMGYALARAALRAGHKVTLITAPTALRPPAGAQVVHVESAAEMLEAVKEHFPDCDCLIMAAAVADYTPKRPARTKIKKQAAGFTIELKPTRDILKWAGKHKHVGWGLPHRKQPARAGKTAVEHRPKIVVGFALEDRDLRANAERKLREKNLDMIVANKPLVIGAGKSTVHIKTLTSDWIEVANVSKGTIAGRIISLIERQRA